MKVLVVAEGKHELSTEHAAYSGALCELVRRVLPAANCLPRPIRDLKKHLHGSVVRGKHQAYEKRALRWLKEAFEQRFDALILLVDEDGHKERIQGFDCAQQSTRWNLPRAMGVAVRTFDAWMLADEAALSKAAGTTIQRQPSPESLKDPKQLFRSLIGDHAADQAELYSRIATALRIEVLKERCPTGFGPFLDRLQSLASAEK